ncbi:Rho GTPase-activating protein 25, partial [Thoreauomyces humboldtii]
MASTSDPQQPQRQQPPHQQHSRASSLRTLPRLPTNPTISVDEVPGSSDGTPTLPRRSRVRAFRKRSVLPVYIPNGTPHVRKRLTCGNTLFTFVLSDETHIRPASASDGDNAHGHGHRHGHKNGGRLELPSRSETDLSGSSAPTPHSDWWAGVAKWATGRFRSGPVTTTVGTEASSSGPLEGSAGEEGKARIRPRVESLVGSSSPATGTTAITNSDISTISTTLTTRPILPRSTSLDHGRTFGVPLEVLVQRERVRGQSEEVAPLVPLIVRTCTDWLDVHAIDKEGLYRVPGSIKKVTAYQEQMDAGTFSFSEGFPDHESPHTVASLLKRYLAALPESMWGSQETKLKLRLAAT